MAAEEPVTADKSGNGSAPVLGSVVVHEVNNLMTIVIANLALASAHPSSEQQRDQLQRAAWAAKLVARLTQQALTMVRTDHAEGPVIDVSRAISGMDSLGFQFEGRNITLVQQFSPETLRVRIDLEALELSLINLIRNAVHAMPSGGCITITTGLGPTPDWVEVAVADTGLGIPDEILARITEPFFTTKAPGHGTGLGLAVVRAFIEQAAGKIKIDTAPGEGTTVRMHFPRVALA
jgi:signal transduction histidine kinase